jgi:methionyl-tRNA synthetase
MTRVESARVTQMIESSRTTAATPAPAGPEPTAEIDIEAFQKIDLRIGRVVSAEPVEGADRLLRVTVDLGTGTRSVLAGIRAGYSAADLIGRNVVVVANLKPRKMRFGVSEGMLLAASGDGPGVFLVSADAGSLPGMRVR